jgi:CHASE3 domain sensor protein
MKTLLARRITIILFLISILTTFVTGFWAYHKYQSALQVNADIIESYQTLRAANQSLLSINEASMNVSTYIITNDTNTIAKIPELILSAQINLAALNQLIQDTPEQLKISKELTPLFDEKITFLKKITAESAAGNKEMLVKTAEDPNRLVLTNHIIQLIIDIKKIEAAQLENSIRTLQLNKVNANNFYILSGSLDILLLLLSYFCMRRCFVPQ